jgi:hypothetical protein
MSYRDVLIGLLVAILLLMCLAVLLYASPMQAIVEEFAAEGHTYIDANCPRCRVIRLRSKLRALAHCYRSSRGGKLMSSGARGASGLTQDDGEKTQIARRQLGTALALFLENYDPVSVHTLTCAGCEIGPQRHQARTPLTSG